MNKNSRIYIAGHRGLVGSALLRRLQSKGYHNFVLRTHAELDLRNQAAVQAFFAQERPEYVILAAAKVGGIHANNTYPAEFIEDNLLIQNNVIHNARKNAVCRFGKKFGEKFGENHSVPAPRPHTISKSNPFV